MLNSSEFAQPLPSNAEGVKFLSPTKHLIGPHFDILFLGGASILVWLLFFLTKSLNHFNPISVHLSSIPATMTTLLLFCNYPHFIASYKIAYSQGTRYLVKNWWELILVPVLLFFIFSFTYWLIQKEMLVYSELMMSLMLDLMFLTVGWHYAKQTFGCMMMSSKFSKYNLSLNQRKALLLHIHSIWLLLFAYTHTVPNTDFFFGFAYTSRILLPQFLLIFWALVFMGSFVYFLWTVIFLKYKQEKVFPGLEFWTPLVALYLWWLPFFALETFNSHVVPFFHSLQYLIFVHKYETTSRQVEGVKRLPLLALFLVLCFVGFLAFEGLPGWIDEAASPGGVGVAIFFTAAFSIFINVHHYFIDSVIWRMDNSHIKKFLSLAV